MEYPFGVGFDIPTGNELIALDILDSSDDIFSIIRGIKIFELDYDGYDLWIFAIRMAIFGADKNKLDYFSRTIWCAVISMEFIDWRDALVGLSLIEDCGVRCGFDIFKIINNCTEFISDDGNRILHGYQSRSDATRSTEIMGYKFDGISIYFKK